MTATELIKLLQGIDPDAIVQLMDNDGFHDSLEYWDGESGDWVVLWEDGPEDEA